MKPCGGSSGRWCSDMDGGTGDGLVDRGKQFLLDETVMGELIHRHMDHHNRDLELGEILLMLQTAVDCYQNVEFLMGY